MQSDSITNDYGDFDDDKAFYYIILNGEVIVKSIKLK